MQFLAPVRGPRDPEPHSRERDAYHYVAHHGRQKRMAIGKTDSNEVAEVFIAQNRK